MQEIIRKELMVAMKAKDSLRVSVLRGLIPGFTNELIAKGKKPQDAISDEDAQTVIKRAVKQRKDSIDQFTKGNRPELAAKEEAELKILETYLPAQIPREEVERIARALKEKMSLTDKSSIGPFMGALIKELGGSADGKIVKEVVESLFS